MVARSCPVHSLEGGRTVALPHLQVWRWANQPQGVCGSHEGGTKWHLLHHRREHRVCLFVSVPWDSAQEGHWGPIHDRSLDLFENESDSSFSLGPSASHAYSNDFLNYRHPYSNDSLNNIAIQHSTYFFISIPCVSKSKDPIDEYSVQQLKEFDGKKLSLSSISSFLHETTHSCSHQNMSLGHEV